MATFWELAARSVSNFFSIVLCLVVIFIYFPFWFLKRDLPFGCSSAVHCFSITFNKMVTKLKNYGAMVRKTQKTLGC